jgi:hypothetical protein
MSHTLSLFSTHTLSHSPLLFPRHPQVEQNGQMFYKVVPMEQALDLANINKFDENKEVYGLKQRKAHGGGGGGGAGGGADGKGAAAAAGGDAVVWRECEGSIAATGQRFRFFYNVETGESCYDQPAVYLPIGPGNSGKKPTSAPT